MFSKKKTEGKDKAKTKAADINISLDTLEMESVAEQLREIEEKKKKDKKPS